MLVQFSFSNYKCFKDENRLNLVAPSSAVARQFAHSTSFKYGVYKVLSIYGANASGKSKALEAFKFMRCVISPPKRENKIPLFEFWQTLYDPFRLDTVSRQKESFFEVIFLIDEIQYRYGFELNATGIISEWLYQKKQREVLVLSRNADLKITINSNYINTKISDNITSANMISKAVPAVSVLSTFNDPLCRKIVDWFESVAVISANDIKSPGVLVDPERTRQIVKFLKAFDINIEGLSLHELPLEDIPEKIRLILDVKDKEGTFYDAILTQHIVYNELYERDSFTNFKLEVDESFGTNRLFHLSWPIIQAVKKGCPILIDEIDSGIHANIVRTLIALFRCCSSKAQLIFSTHNTSLLNAKEEDGKPLIGKDQIYVVNKNRYGVSSLSLITDFDADFRSNLEKVYLSGEVTGVPYVDLAAILDIVEGQ